MEKIMDCKPMGRFRSGKKGFLLHPLKIPLLGLDFLFLFFSIDMEVGSKVCFWEDVWMTDLPSLSMFLMCIVFLSCSESLLFL